MDMDAHDKDRNRSLDFREFSRMVREREMAIQTEEALRKRFKAMDLDGSDEISMAEFIKFALKDAYQRSEHAWSSCSRSGTRTGTARSRLRSSFASSASTPSSPRSSRSSTARAKPEAAGDPVSIACGDAGGGWRGRRAESEGLLPLSTPAVATERCATEVPVTAPWGSPFGEVPPAGSRSGERMVPATAPSAVPGSRPSRLTSRKSAGSDEPVA